MLTPEPAIIGMGMDVEVGCSAAKAWLTLPDWVPSGCGFSRPLGKAILGFYTRSR